jgi:hypothetical protein
VAKGYLEWLSQQTGYAYRLPSYREWFAAASAGGEVEQANRNCLLKFGSTNKGIELVEIKAGKNNKYGLVNHVLNVRLWFLDGDKKLMVAVVHRQDPMSRCLATTKIIMTEVLTNATDSGLYVTSVKITASKTITV